MPQKYKTKSVCVVDFGLFASLAECLTRWFGQVYYHYFYKSAFPNSNAGLVGHGMPGIKVVTDLGEIRDEVDCWVFPDTYLGDVQEELRAGGAPVFGSGYGDELELQRVKAKKLFKKLGLAVGPYEVVKGLDNLRQFLKEHRDRYVKCSFNRGDFETFYAPNYRFIESKLDALEHSLGLKKYLIDFVVEEAIPEAVEVGYDGFCIDGQFPKQSLVGIEIKSKGYVGRMCDYAQLPPQIREFNDKIGPILKKYGYRNSISSELRITRQKKSYVLDPCLRGGNPPMAAELEFYNNLGEIIWEGAHGRLVTPTSEHEWAAQIQLTSDWADSNRVNVQFPERLRPYVKLINGARLQGQYWVIPQDYKITNVGAVVAGGKTMQEAISLCQARAEQVKGYFLECDPHALDEAEAEWAKLKEYGIEL